jgi:hypothetical protein
VTDRPAATDARSELMRRHAAACAARDASELGSEEFRAAAEEVARIEIEIALLEEPPMENPPADTQAARAQESPR